MKHAKLVELLFFYTIIIAVAVVLYLLFLPYIIAVIMAGLLVIIMYPLHQKIRAKLFPRQATLAAVVSTAVSLSFVILPLIFIISLLSRELFGVYDLLQNIEEFSVNNLLTDIQISLTHYLPNIDFSVTETLKTLTGWGIWQLQALFANILAFSVSILVIVMTIFFLFRDGQKFILWLIATSPLTDEKDKIILHQIHTAVLAVLAGVAIVSLLQGIVAGLGFWIFAVPKPVLWGTVAALGGLLPGIGTPVIMIPAVVYLWLGGHTLAALGLLIWATMAMIIIDNIISPLLMSRGNKLHPLVVLLSILGGVSLFGIIGVIIGPVIASIFLVLIQLQKKFMTVEN